MRRFLDRLLNLFRLRASDKDLGREMESHLALLQDAHERRGLSPDAARRAARLAFGGIDQAKERCRDVRSFGWIEDVRRDVGHGLHLLRRGPLFTLTAAASLAIGIGANTAIATIANSLIFRPAPGIFQPEALVDIGTARGDGGLNPFSYATYLEVARRTTSLSSTFAQEMFPHVMSLVPPDTGVAERAIGQQVTANFFAALGVSPSLGRLSAENDDAVAILDAGYWTRRFNGDPGVIGRQLRLNGRLVTIVGVAAPDFVGTGLQTRDIWIASGGDGSRLSSVIAGGRVRPGVSAAAAAAEVTAIGNAVNSERAEADRVGRLNALPYTRAGGNRNIVRAFAGVLMVLISLLLVVACANVAGIVLSRSTARRREMSLRSALGAGRGRLVRQLLTETVVLYLLGGLLGVALASVLLRLPALLPGLPAPLVVPLTLDWRVLLFALSLSLCAALVFGVFPAFKSSNVQPAMVLKDGARSSSGRSRLRSAFVVGQIALSILLVVLGALFVRVLREAGASDPGFDARRVEIAALDLSMSGERQEGTPAFWRNAIDRVRQLPAVEAASLARVPPGGLEGVNLGGVSPGDAPAPAEMFIPSWNIVEAGYFATIRIPLVAGRDFSAADDAGAEPVTIVSETIARRFWPGQNPVGRPLTLEVFNARARRTERHLATVVGVAADIRSSSLVDGFAAPYVYVPLAQTTTVGIFGMTTQMSIVVRRRGETLVGSDIAAVVHDIDPRLVLVSTQSLSDAIALGLTAQRVLAAVSGISGMVGLLLAAMGIYGVTAYNVTLRRREFAIRLALGAPRARVLAMVLRQGLWLVALGALIGLPLAAGAGQVLSVFFYGLPPTHMPTLLGSLALFVAIGGVACLVPAGRLVRTGWRGALQDD